MNEKSKQLIIENISFFKEFVDRVNSYQIVNLDIIRVIYFLTQFKSYEEIKIIIKLLKKIDFLDSSSITYLLKMAYGKIDVSLLKKPLISSLGGIQDSSTVVCYQVVKNLFDNESDTLSSIISISSIGENILTKKPTSIILFGDNITSGTQLEDFFLELIEGKDKPEFFAKPLKTEEYTALQNIPIRICYAIQLSESSNDVVEKIRKKYNLDLQFYSGRVDFNNYLDFQANVLSSENESSFAKKFVSEIAYELYNDKDWSKETVYSRILGYGNLGKLSVFYYNVPKSLISVFWKFGFYDQKPWLPLFPEIQEQKKILQSGVEMNFYVVEAIKSWLHTTSSSRAPKLSFGFFENSDIQTEITVSIPSKEFIKKEFINKLTLKRAEYIENVVPSTRSMAHILRLETSLKSVLSQNDYERYKIEIDSYNHDLEQFYKSLEDYVYKLSSTKEFTFILMNSGDLKASNFTTKLYYNTSTITINNYEDFEPTFEKDIPNINTFYTPRLGEIMAIHNPTNFLIPKVSYKKRELIQAGSDYEWRIHDDRLGHNDHYLSTVKMTRVDDRQSVIEIPYDLNFDEEAETKKGKLKIIYNEIEEIDNGLATKINDLIRSFDKIISRF